MPSATSVNAPPRQRGFTLIELMVTLAVMVILASIGFSATHWVQRQQLDNETRALQQRLEAVHQLAVATRGDWQVCALNMSDDTAECGSDWADGYQWFPLSGEAARLSGRHPLDGVALSSNRSTLSFRSAPWQTHGANGTLTLCNAAGSNQVVINDGYRIYVEYDTGVPCP